MNFSNLIFTTSFISVLCSIFARIDFYVLKKFVKIKSHFFNLMMVIFLYVKIKLKALNLIKFLILVTVAFAVV